jgi:pimeloyl-ACP methyl ester carboxylesterase
MGDAATVMLVHGAFHGSWCWDSVRAELHRAGVPSAVVENPSVTHPGSDLAADGDNLRRSLDVIDGPVVLVGHSYGGAVISDAGVHPSVEHLVFLTALVLDSGESASVNELTGGEGSALVDAMVFDDGMLTVDPQRVVDLFFHDCAPDVAAGAAAQLRPMTMAAMTAGSRAAAWRERPSTYVVCTDDRALPVPLQRSCADRIGTVVEIPTSHSPFLSRPGELATMLAALAAR